MESPKMTDAPTSSPGARLFDEGSSPTWRSLVQLFLQPTRLFTSSTALASTPYLLLVTWIVGISGAISRIDKQIMKAEYSLRPEYNQVLGYFVGSWVAFWLTVMVSGIVGALFIRWLGGWWYNVRLRWSGATGHDKRAGRIVYIYTSLISALPSVLLVVSQMFFCANYRIAYESKGILPLLLIPFPFLAVINSYRAARSVFELNKTKARIWFLALPIAVSVIAVGAIAILLSYIGRIHK